MSNPEVLKKILRLRTSLHMYFTSYNRCRTPSDPMDLAFFDHDEKLVGYNSDIKLCLAGH